jgi:3'-phosphoadenosine 5'-phosphosulfate sulfotransferase (PAPS reductase)/FAD synthetase
MDVIRHTLKVYPEHQVALSFNGGKDCTVIYYLLKLLGVQDIGITYFTYDDCFEELHRFTQDVVKESGWPAY